MCVWTVPAASNTLLIWHAYMCVCVCVWLFKLQSALLPFAQLGSSYHFPCWHVMLRDSLILIFFLLIFLSLWLAHCLVKSEIRNFVQTQITVHTKMKHSNIIAKVSSNSKSPMLPVTKLTTLQLIGDSRSKGCRVHLSHCLRYSCTCA